MAGFHSKGAADLTEAIEVTVTLHPQSPIDAQEIIQNATLPKTQKITREEAERRFSASAACIDRVKKFAQEHNLKVECADPVKRTVVLSGTVSAFNDAFGVSLERFEKGAGVVSRAHWAGSHTGRIERRRGECSGSG
jgi:kumamolisin